MTDAFGPLQGLPTVEAGLVSLFQSQPVTPSGYPLIVWYLATAERRMGLRARTIPVPPGPAAYRGGMDWLSYQEDQYPLIVVQVAPDGPPVPIDSLNYGQTFEVQVGAFVEGQSEDEARSFADGYGLALALLIAQHGSLGIGASGTLITEGPRRFFLDPEMRASLLEVVTFTTYLAPVFTTSAPYSFDADPYGDVPVPPSIEEIGITVDAVPPTT